MIGIKIGDSHVMPCITLLDRCHIFIVNEASIYFFHISKVVKRLRLYTEEKFISAAFKCLLSFLYQLFAAPNPF